jgi:hypothetical protein
VSTEDWEAEAKARESERIARRRAADKLKVASSIFRELVAWACQRRSKLINDEVPLDYRAMACEASEATEELLTALEGKPPADFPLYQS